MRRTRDPTNELPPKDACALTSPPAPSQQHDRAPAGSRNRQLTQSTIELLRSTPELFERLLNTVTDALFVVDEHRRIIFWNKQAEALTGFTSEEVLEEVCLRGIHCEKCTYGCDLFAAEGAEVRNIDVTIRNKAGETLVCTKNAYVLKDGSGQIVGGVEFLKDKTALVRQIAEINQQREQIKAREQLQSAVLSSIREGVVTVGRDRRITSFSRRAEAIFGRRAEWAVGRPCFEVLGSALCGTDCPHDRCLQAGNAEVECSTELRTDSGVSIPLVVVALPLRDENRDLIGSVLIIEQRSELARSSTSGSKGVIYAGMVARSEAMQQVFKVIEQVAPTEATVLITGESGTGKEMVARAIHHESPRRNGPFQAINCAALPEGLLEGEMFGHVRGAFTGAIHDRPGRVEQAQGGTLFLDEVGDLPLSLQAKLLRFVQDREYQRVGESTTRRADVRILAATNRDLERAVKEARFREDLFYRIRVIPVHLVPLRERPEDIPLLAVHLLGEISGRLRRPALTLTPGSLDRLAGHAWPGNVRELVNVLEHAAILCPRRRIRAVDLPPEIKGVRSRYRAPGPIREKEIESIREALVAARGNRSEAARLIGMNRVTLYRKLKRLAIPGSEQDREPRGHLPKTLRPRPDPGTSSDGS